MDKTFCIFGDSVTQAAYVDVGWVDLLRHYLEQKYPSDFINVFNLGVGGNTSSDIVKRLDSEASARNPTHIIIAVGVNDESPAEIINFEKLVQNAQKYTKNITFVGLVNNYSYNALIRSTIEKQQCKFIDLINALEPSDFMDELHPNDQGHKKMFEEIKKHF